ncbi:hypothetical protein A2U01_0100477, partial [Trifolium medium]|nr:hypothetical protein [Trifolium medium]
PTEAIIEYVLESLNEKSPVTNAVEDAMASAGQGNFEKTVIPESPETVSIPEKEKYPETTRADNVSGDNTAVISQS